MTDGHLSTYLWSGPGTFTDTSVEDATWTAPAAETTDQDYTLRLTVMDDDGAMAFAEVVVTVNGDPLEATTVQAVDTANAPWRCFALPRRGHG